VALNYGYDANGNVISLWSSTTGGVSNVFHYDALNHLTNVLANGNEAASYGFDLAGNLQTMRYGNGVTNQYQYDALHRLTNLVCTSVNGAVASFYYELGLTGNRTNLTETLNSTSRTYQWQYDSIYRLTTENINGGIGTIGYGYDLVGNRLSRSPPCAAPAPPAATVSPTPTGSVRPRWPNNSSGGFWSI
jgi:YD repeat-containing protein